MIRMNNVEDVIDEITTLINPSVTIDIETRVGHYNVIFYIEGQDASISICQLTTIENVYNTLNAIAQLLKLKRR